MKREEQRRSRPDQGIALITVVLILALVSTLAVSAMDQTGEELQAGGRSRATTKTIFAADSGIQVAMDRVRAPADLTPIAFAMADGTTVESREREDAAPQPLDRAGFGKPPEGFSLNVGSGFVNEVFAVDVTADAPGSSLVEIEAKLGVLTSNAGGS